MPGFFRIGLGLFERWQKAPIPALALRDRSAATISDRSGSLILTRV